MKLIVISYPDNLQGEAQQINRLFKHGLAHFHLRKPQWEATQVEQLIGQIEKQYHPRITIHHHFHLAKKYHLRGIHFSASARAEMEQWISFPGSKSISCHTLEELENLSGEMDYAFLSPVFDSISKTGYKGAHHLKETGNFLETYTKCKVFALGGIDAENIHLCEQSGFKGVAVLGAVWQNQSSANNSLDDYLKIQEACQANVRM